MLLLELLLLANANGGRLCETLVPHHIKENSCWDAETGTSQSLLELLIMMRTQGPPPKTNGNKPDEKHPKMSTRSHQSIFHSLTS